MTVYLCVYLSVSVSVLFPLQQTPSYHLQIAGLLYGRDEQKIIVRLPPAKILDGGHLSVYLYLSICVCLSLRDV